MPPAKAVGSAELRQLLLDPVQTVSRLRAGASPRGICVLVHHLGRRERAPDSASVRFARGRRLAAGVSGLPAFAAQKEAIIDPAMTIDGCAYEREYDGACVAAPRLLGRLPIAHRCFVDRASLIVASIPASADAAWVENLGCGFMYCCLGRKSFLRFIYQYFGRKSCLRSPLRELGSRIPCKLDSPCKLTRRTMYISSAALASSSTALARSSSTVLASSSTVLANSSCVTISLWARLVLAEFVLNSGRREKVSSPGVALDPSPSNVVVRTIRGRTRGMRGRFQPRGLGLLIIIGSSRVPGKHLLFCLDVASCCFVLMCLCVCAAPKRRPRDRLRAAHAHGPR